MEKLLENVRLETHLDLALVTGLAAHRFDDGAAVGPDLIIVDLQATVVPTTHIDVVVIILTHLLKVHDLVPGGGRIILRLGKQRKLEVTDWGQMNFSGGPRDT